ncbi:MULTISPECIES: hypothetical protein [Sphingobacterium]|jgi:hypothetical protein|uniref:hypothetical protein n=1 Tax=Sphingobacterium TaxID=28453 RepID=UPI0028AAF40B|nr:hypothetical protein [Sphingobacterium multivorum]
MQKLGLLIILLTLFSCKKEEGINSVNVYSEVRLALADEDGNNIFESKGASLGIGDLDLYYVNEEGKREIQNNSNLDLPKHMDIVDEESLKEKVLKVFGNLTPQSDGYAESILVVKGYAEISIKLKVESSGASKGYSQILVNGMEISKNQLGHPIPVKLAKLAE